ncbi:SPOR domain-containing protein [Flavobacterium sp.]|uniref:HU domain-containing protein n=1 Tax=Flavobacterium sp. TaxID=239 RepID=UPI0035280C2A
MIIENYIANLLYRHNCIIVPNFGAFITETVSAKLDGNTTFTPPRKVITFNANIKNNDGLLTNYIAVAEKISFEKATQKIETQVLEWQTILADNNSISLSKIGTLVFNKSNNSLFFSPDTTTNYLTSSFGLSQFASPKILRETLKQDVAQLEEKAPILIAPKRKANNYTFLKYAAVFALLGTVGAFGYKQYYDIKVEKEMLLVQKNVQEKVQQKLQQATFFIEAPSIVVELPVSEEKLHYHIIAGAFRNDDNAKKAQQVLLNKGFNATTLPQNKHGLYPVTFGSFKTKEEAEMEKLKLHNQGHKEAWLLIE